MLLKNITFPLAILFIDFILSLIFYYHSNTKYQKEFLSKVYDELRLNEIYLVTKRRQDEGEIEEIYKALAYKKIEREYLYSFRSLLDMDFYQMFSFMHRRKDYSLLIKSKVDHGVDGFIQMRFNTKYTIEEYKEKGIFQYNFYNPKKYPFDLYANSSLGKDTYKIVDDNVIKTMIQLKMYTNVNIIATITNDLFYVLIPGWELKLTDSLFKKLKYDTMDKKIEIFTELIDEITDLYIYLINKEDVWEKKW